MNLYELNSKYVSVISMAEQIAEANEGVIPDTLAVELDNIEADRNAKIENVIKYIKNTEAMADAIAAEAKALRERQSALDNRSGWLRKYLATVIGEGNKVELPCGRVSWRSSTSVEIVNDFGLPETCFKIERTLMKSEVKKLIEDGTVDEKTAKLVTKKSMQLK